MLLYAAFETVYIIIYVHLNINNIYKHNRYYRKLEIK